LRKIASVFVIAIAFSCIGGPLFADKVKSMADLIDSDEVLKTYVADIKNSSGNSGIDLKGLKKRLENTLAERPPRKFDFSGNTPTKKFEIVDHKKDADITISSVVIEFIWMDKDPVDMIIGVGAVAYDALVEESYARMQVVFTVNHAKTGMLLWKDRTQATITDKGMTEEESYGRVEERITKIFMRELFKEE